MNDALEKFIQKKYIQNKEMGSPDIKSAIRDILTDLLHLGDKHGINIAERLYNAEEVYEEEINAELSTKTGVIN